MTGAEKAMQHSLDAAAGDADEGPEAGAHVLRPLDQSHSHATWRLSKHRRAPPGIRGRKQGHGPRRRTEKDGALTRPLQLTHLRLGGSLRSPRTIRSFLSSSFLDAATIASRPAERLRTESFSLLVDCRAARCSHLPESIEREAPACSPAAGSGRFPLVKSGRRGIGRSGILFQRNACVFFFQRRKQQAGSSGSEAGEWRSACPLARRWGVRFELDSPATGEGEIMPGCDV